MHPPKEFRPPVCFSQVFDKPSETITTALRELQQRAGCGSYLMVVVKENPETLQYHPHLNYDKTSILFVAHKMNLRDLVTWQANIPIAVLRDHQNGTRHISTGDSTRGGSQEEGAWCHQPFVFSRLCFEVCISLGKLSNFV